MKIIENLYTNQSSSSKARNTSPRKQEMHCWDECAVWRMPMHGQEGSNRWNWTRRLESVHWGADRPRTAATGAGFEQTWCQDLPLELHGKLGPKQQTEIKVMLIMAQLKFLNWPRGIPIYQASEWHLCIACAAIPCPLSAYLVEKKIYKEKLRNEERISSFLTIG